MNTENAIIGPDPEKVKGCKFCGATSVKYDGKGRAWWHPSVGCCAPSAVLQLVWRSADAHFAGERYDQAAREDVKRGLGVILDDARVDLRDAQEAFANLVRNRAALEAAVSECRERGYELNFAAAFRELNRRAA